MVGNIKRIKMRWAGAHKGGQQKNNLEQGKLYGDGYILLDETMKKRINFKKIIARVGRPRGKYSNEVKRRVVWSIILQRRGFSQSQIGKYLGVSKKSVNRYQHHPNYRKYREKSTRSNGEEFSRHR